MRAVNEDYNPDPLGLCGWILTVFSYVLVVLTFPFSLCVCLKVWRGRPASSSSFIMHRVPTALLCHGTTLRSLLVMYSKCTCKPICVLCASVPAPPHLVSIHPTAVSLGSRSLPLPTRHRTGNRIGFHSDCDSDCDWDWDLQ